MAKKIVGYIKLQVPAGKANPSPPIGPALGQRGLNIMEFCKAFNAQTQGVEPQEAPGEDVVVTGTRIVRDGFQAPTPLTVITETEIDNGSPSNNIADFVNTLPSLAGSTRPSNSRLNISSGQAGINALKAGTPLAQLRPLRNPWLE